jgi:hypothetical protein
MVPTKREGQNGSSGWLKRREQHKPRRNLPTGAADLWL